MNMARTRLVRIGSAATESLVSGVPCRDEEVAG